MPLTGFGSNFRAGKVLALLGTTALALALCSVSSVPSSFAQPAKLAAVPAGKPVRSADGKGSSSAASRLKQIAAAAASESKATFDITYVTTGSGNTSQFTIEQKLPDQLFKQGSGEVLYNGRKTYYCSSSPSGTTCLVYGSIDASPLAGLVEVYSAATYIAIMQSWESILAYGIAGVHVSFTSATFARQASQCVTWSYQGSNAKYCVTDNGILAYVGGSSKGSSSSSSFELKSYSPHVNSSDFNLPRGAKVSSYP